MGYGFPWRFDRDLGSGELSRTVLALMDDLFFTSKLASTAQGLEKVTLVCYASGRGLIEKALQGPPDLIVLDLGAAHLEPLGVLKALTREASLVSVPRVGYCSHVERDLMLEASKSGCDRVLPRSAFTENLPAILQGLPF